MKIGAFARAGLGVSISVFSAMFACGAEAAPPPVTISQLQGNWTATFGGATGCGSSSFGVNFTLDASGNSNGTATLKGHSTGCPDAVTTGQNFVITALNADGSGNATLTCGSNCGWTFHIQVNREDDQFTVTDLTDGNNMLAGVSIKRQ